MGSPPETHPDQGDNLVDGESIDLPSKAPEAPLRRLLGDHNRTSNPHGKRIHLPPSEVQEATSRAKKARAKTLGGQSATRFPLNDAWCCAERRQKERIDKLKEKFKRLKRKLEVMKESYTLGMKLSNIDDRGVISSKAFEETVKKLRDA